MENVDKILKTYYNQYEEENRFKKSNHNRLEFITTTKNTNTICLHEVATDGIAQAMQMYIDQLSEAEFEEWIKYHLATCERKDLRGYSSHILHICQKK